MVTQTLAAALGGDAVEQVGLDLAHFLVPGANLGGTVVLVKSREGLTELVVLLHEPPVSLLYHFRVHILEEDLFCELVEFALQFLSLHFIIICAQIHPAFKFK
jgi:hypothetical protein